MTTLHPFLRHPIGGVSSALSIVWLSSPTTKRRLVSVCRTHLAFEISPLRNHRRIITTTKAFDETFETGMVHNWSIVIANKFLLRCLIGITAIIILDHSANSSVCSARKLAKLVRGITKTVLMQTGDNVGKWEENEENDNYFFLPFFAGLSSTWILVILFGRYWQYPGDASRSPEHFAERNKHDSRWAISFERCDSHACSMVFNGV